MLRPLTGSLVVLVFAGSLLTVGAQEKGKEKKSETKGMKAKITKVDAAKNTISVTTEAGKKVDVLVGKDTKFIGPKGGVSDEGIKDDRVAVGNEISIVLGTDKKTAAEIHLPYREKDKPEEKKPAKKGDKKPGDK